MTVSKIEIHNAITNEIVRRDLNETELAEAQTDKAQAIKDAETKAKADKTKAAARQAVLNKLGLTADEVTALLG